MYISAVTSVTIINFCTMKCMQMSPERIVLQTLHTYRYLLIIDDCTISLHQNIFFLFVTESCSKLWTISFLIQIFSLANYRGSPERLRLSNCLHHGQTPNDIVQWTIFTCSHFGCRHLDGCYSHRCRTQTHKKLGCRSYNSVINAIQLLFFYNRTFKE